MNFPGMNRKKEWSPKSCMEHLTALKSPFEDKLKQDNKNILDRMMEGKVGNMFTRGQK